MTGDEAQVRSLFQLATEKYEQAGDWMALARLLERTGHRDQAIDVLLSRATAGDPNAAVELAGVHERAGDLGQAEDVLRDFADHPAVAVLLAGLLERADRLDEAEKLWWHAFSLDSSAETYPPLVWRLDAAGRPSEAMSVLRKMVALGDTTAMLALARRLSRAGSGDEARELIGRAADLGDPAATHEWARCLENAGRPAEAERVVRRSPGRWWRLAAQAERADELDRAQKFTERAADAGDTASMHAVARMYESAGHPDAAKDQLRRAAADARRVARAGRAR
ncbi:tetratricopeptide repeat protein [Fodinicola feengrottensis]|uniref:tetratricopeptide repeat protein n=1 Tax=Fodinicola feengrottensis TaxID=435914 RepID=UPI0013D615C3|nr:hypothetical protein [Fodinicola feengrottensis]